MNCNITIIKTKPTFEEAINDFDNLHRDDFCDTMKEMVNMMMNK